MIDITLENHMCHAGLIPKELETIAMYDARTNDKKFSSRFIIVVYVLGAFLVYTYAKHLNIINLAT